MFGVSRADGLCLAALLWADVSVWAWWKQHHRPEELRPPAATSRTGVEAMPAPPPPEIAAASADTPPTAAAAEPEDGKPFLRWQHAYGDYRVVVTGTGEDGERLMIFQNGRLVFETVNHNFTDPEELPAEGEPPTTPRPMTDLTGEGQPCLVIESYSGGAHCCTQLDVFQLGEEFKQIDTIEAEHGGAVFTDVDGDGIAEAQLQDWSYAYVFTCFAGSPAPAKILRYQDGKYINAPDLLFTAPPTDDEYTALVREVQDAYQPGTNADEAVQSPAGWDGDAKLWGAMLELTYAGQLELAMDLFEKCWRDDWPDKDKALDHFWDVVGAGEYGRVVVQAQGYDLPEPRKDDTASMDDSNKNDSSTAPLSARPATAP